MAPKTIPLDEVVQVLRRQAQLHENHAFSMFIEAAAQHLELQDQLLATYAKHTGAAPGDLLDNYKIARPKDAPQTEHVTGRKALNALYLEYVNNYLTIEKFADNNGLTTDQGQRLIELAREIHNSPHPEG